MGGGVWLLGLGARAGVPERDLDLAVDLTLAGAGLQDADIAALATLDRRAEEPAVQALAARRGWPLIACTAADLAAQPVPTPADRVAALTGTPSVAEAAALRAAGEGSTLTTPKQIHKGVTTALAKRPADPTPQT